MLNFSTNTSYSLTGVHSPNKQFQERVVSHEVSLIFTLIVRETLTLTSQIFIDSVNFIAHTCDIKNKQIYHYLLLKETVKLHQLSTSASRSFKSSSHDEFTNFMIPTLLNINPGVSQNRERVTGIHPSLLE